MRHPKPGRQRASSLAAAIVLSSAIGRAASIQDSSLTSQVDAVFAQWDRTDSPGCSVAIVKDGRIVYERGYGMADLEHDVRITPTSVFYAGSVSKQFTAMAIALLAQEGALGLDDDIRKFIPELPQYPATISIRHLIHHTSGLPEYVPAMAQAGIRPDTPYSNRDVLGIMSRLTRVNFSPGEQFSYSNAGYTLLATIVERAAGMSLAQFATDRIFDPLGMNATHFHPDASRLVRDRAYGYEPAPGGGLRLARPLPTSLGAGGVFTTVEDLARWDQNFYDSRVGGAELIAQLVTPGALNSGRPIEYAFGLEVRRYQGRLVVEHGGDLGGYHAYLGRFPDEHLSVILLCNGEAIHQIPLARQLEELYLRR